MLLSYFLLHSTFFKGKVKSESFGGFYCCFSIGLFEKWVFFWLGPIASTLKIIMDV